MHVSSCLDTRWGSSHFGCWKGQQAFWTSTFSLNLIHQTTHQNCVPEKFPWCRRVVMWIMSCYHWKQPAHEPPSYQLQKRESNKTGTVFNYYHLSTPKLFTHSKSFLAPNMALLALFQICPRVAGRLFWGLRAKSQTWGPLREKTHVGARWDSQRRSLHRFNWMQHLQKTDKTLQYFNIV